VIEDSTNDFGSQPEELAASPTLGTIIPFPRMRANTLLAERWAALVEQRNTKNGTAYRLIAAADAIEELIRLRAMPALSWPPAWTEMTRRVRVYPRDMVGVVGSQGGGKTSFALQAAIAAAAAGTPVCWAALELNPPQILTRAIGNIHGVHAAAVRDSWPRVRIAHSAAAFTDMFHFVDRIRDPEKQLAAMRESVSIAWELYRVPPLLVVDHIGKLFSNARDPNVGATQALEALREITEELDCITMPLSQGSRGNQAVLTGKVDIDAASDAMGVAAQARAFEEDCSYVLALVVFKLDDTSELDSHVLATKCRHTGLEGRMGFRFVKQGGRWNQLDYLPATPAQVKVDIEKARKNKGRVAPPPTPLQARADINAANAGDAAAMRRVKMLEAITRHGMLGIEINELRKIHGVGRGPAFHASLQELERAGSCERIGTRVRVIARME
jgi:KaiC/GvpD/RAD55 family RecA-like ATPase